ncbi:MAG: nicotinamide riboside transporter PnuC [Christensenellaceae bacterium]
MVILCGLFGKDKWYNILFSALAVVYLLLLTEGRRCGYLLCCIYAVGYAVISLRTGFYATAAFHGLFLFPVSVYRFLFSQRKAHRRRRSGYPKAWMASVVLCPALSVGLYFLLRKTGDVQPLLDSVILSLSLLTSAMMFGNYREMWWFNLAASALYVVMWLTEFFSSGTGLSFAVMQTVVSVINIKGIVDWKKLKNDG